MARKLRHLLEAAIFLLAYGLFRALPLDTASALGGRLGQRLGPRLKMTHYARTNLAIAFPEKSAEERERILHGMWDNLGRVTAEFAHLRGLSMFKRLSITGMENVPVGGKGTLYVSGHFGNWELCYAAAYEYGQPITCIYRPSNNPWIDRLINRTRLTHATEILAKGPQSGPKLVRMIKQGVNLAMLVDQKMNEGISVPFLGRDAMTPTAVAQFALRFGMPIVPARIVRTQGAHFRMTVYPPLVLPQSGSEEEKTRIILQEIHRIFEGWIHENPEQWFWIHRRFSKEIYRQAS